MEKITEITTGVDTDQNAFETILRCKQLAEGVDITNVIIDNTCIDEKEMLIELIESIRSLELEIVEIDFPYKIGARA
jgi:hypothetical protein|tara:strand:+ start:76 stop:306 length:231 start_codon:yes stop_codon:yes gene_type:complete